MKKCRYGGALVLAAVLAWRLFPAEVVQASPAEEYDGDVCAGYGN